jgi:hypothetical protein
MFKLESKLKIHIANVHKSGLIAQEKHSEVNTASSSRWQVVGKRRSKRASSGDRNPNNSRTEAHPSAVLQDKEHTTASDGYTGTAGSTQSLANNNIRTTPYRYPVVRN